MVNKMPDQLLVPAMHTSWVQTRSLACASLERGHRALTSGVLMPRVLLSGFRCRAFIVVVSLPSPLPSFAHIVLSLCCQDDTLTYPRHQHVAPSSWKEGGDDHRSVPSSKKGELEDYRAASSSWKGGREDESAVPKSPYLCCLLGGLYIGHTIWPSTYADDAKVAPQLEPTSKCMVMCFFGASHESYPICKLFFGRGYPLHFFWPYFIENWEESREPLESLNNQHIGVRSLQISIECGLKQYYNQLWSDNIGESEWNNYYTKHILTPLKDSNALNTLWFSYPPKIPSIDSNSGLRDTMFSGLKARSYPNSKR